LNGAVQRGDKAVDHPKAETEAGNPQPCNLIPKSGYRCCFIGRS